MFVVANGRSSHADTVEVVANIAPDVLVDETMPSSVDTAFAPVVEPVAESVSPGPTPAAVVAAAEVPGDFAETATPPDEPLSPREWSDLFGNGSWMIFSDVIAGKFKDKGKGGREMSSPTTFRNLKGLGITGGRFHVTGSVEGGLLDPDTGLLTETTLAAIEDHVDMVLAEGFALMMQVNFTIGSERNAILESTRWGKEWQERNRIKDEDERLERMRRMVLVDVAAAPARWEQLCQRLAVKSHRLAMCPVIECHLFEPEWMDFRDQLNVDDYMPWLPKGASSIEAYRSYLAECTRIFRKYNPTRIIGHKGYVSSSNKGVPESAYRQYMSQSQLAALESQGKGRKKLKKGGHDDPEALLPNSSDALNWPIGGDPAPGSGLPTYYIAIITTSHPSGPWWDWDVNKEFSNEEILEGAALNYKFIDKWRTKTGIEVFSDHWLPNRHDEDVDYEKMPEKLQKRFESQTAQGIRAPLWSIEQNRMAVEWNYRLYEKYRIANAGPRPDLFVNADGALRTGDAESLSWVNAARRGNGLSPLRIGEQLLADASLPTLEPDGAEKTGKKGKEGKRGKKKTKKKQ
jgi:hypothetical protein